MSIGWSLLHFLVFPGLLYAMPAAWLMLWIQRKLIARMQKRIGPPFYQPFFDFVKLMSKQPVTRSSFDAILMVGLPLLSIGAILASLSLLPVFLNESGFIGDLVLLAVLLEVPLICTVMSGYASDSIFGQVGATREAILSLSYSIPLLGALVALAASAGSLRLSDVVLLPPVAVRVPAILALLLCLPVKLRLNPFSIVNAEQEIYSGPTTEFDGARLALWELSHGLEWVLLCGLIISLSVPVRTGFWLADLLLFVLLSLIVVVIITGVAAGTARLKLAQAARIYWRWGLGLAALSLILAILPVWKG